MPDLSELSPFLFSLKGGLVLDRASFQVDPGLAFELENFEPDTKGGYRRINGFTKWSANTVPYTNLSSERVLMSAMWGPTLEMIAGRGESVYRSTGGTTQLNGAIGSGDTTITVDDTSDFSSTGTILIESEEITYTGITASTFTGCTRGANGTSAAAHVDDTAVSQQWTSIESGRTAAGRYNHFRFNLGGTEYMMWADGSNYASYYDGSSVTSINGTGAPADPQYLTFYKDHAFYAGMGSNPQEVVFSTPFTIDSFNVATGAGSFLLDSPVTGLIPFRDYLYIFSEERIYRLTGSSVSDFEVEHVTRNIGCKNGWTIQEMAGDVVFLGPDGLRTVAGTEKIGDVELGTISRAVQSLFDSKDLSTDLVSLVIPEKTQYRLFFVEDAIESISTGLICVAKDQGFEFATTKGIRPSSSDTLLYGGMTYVMHGGHDGYVYRQEQGHTFNGNTITGKYRSADIDMGDPGIRKALHRVILNYNAEGTVDANLHLRYDYDSPDVARPQPYAISNAGGGSTYGTAVYGTSVYGATSNLVVRQAVEGSGFSVALRIIDNSSTEPYSLKGFQIEFEVGSRR